MEGAQKKEKGKKKFIEVKTFPVPFNLEENKENLTLNTNASSKLSKEQIIKKAFQFHSKGNISEAAKYYQKFIEEGFIDPIVFSNYGVILKSLGNIREAEKFYRKALELKPDYAEAYSNLGNIQSDLGEFKKAELSQRKAIELKADYAIAHSNLGKTLRALGKLEEAEQFARKAIKFNPNYTEAYNNLVSILNDLGKLEEAEQFARKAIEINPDYAIAYSNLGKILTDLGKLKEAEILYQKAIELDPQNIDVQNNLISLLSLYKPRCLKLNTLHLINEEFLRININPKSTKLITDNDAIEIYRYGLNIYKKYHLDIESNFLQIFKQNQISLDCKRHFLIFNNYKIIPEFCFSCYKVQVEAKSIIEFIKLFIIFEYLILPLDNTRKCMVEVRNGISGFYKGFIYCSSLEEASYVSEKIDTLINKYIRSGLESKVKRGCSEFALEFPLYKEINKLGDQPMIYNKNWKSIENEIDKGNREWGKSIKSIEGFNLNNFLIMRNWIAYAQKIGDQSVYKITDEKIRRTELFKDLKRKFYSS